MPFSYRQGVTVTLTGDNTTGQFQAGQFTVNPGQAADAVRFRMRFTLANSGTARVLTDAEKQTFLASFDFTLRHGRNQQFTPFSKADYTVAQKLTRAGRASEWEGYTDTSTGLGQSVDSSTDITLYPRIPLSAFWQQEEYAQLFRVGSLQARGIVIDVRRNTVSLPTDFSLTGSVYLDIVPDESPARYEFYTPIPRYYEWTEANRLAQTIPPGLAFLLLERTAVHASTTMTTVKLSVDGLTLYENCTLGQVITRFHDTPAYFPADADISDRDTLLFALGPSDALRDIPTGKPVFEQQVQSLATMQLGWWGMDVMTESQVDAEVQQLADMAGEPIKCVSAATVMRLDLGKNLYPFMPWCVFRPSEKEFDIFPGKVATPGGNQVYTVLPKTVVARAKAISDAQSSAGEATAAENTVQEATLPIPGAVQGTRGLRQGSAVLDRVRATLRKA